MNGWGMGGMFLHSELAFGAMFFALQPENDLINTSGN